MFNKRKKQKNEIDKSDLLAILRQKLAELILYKEELEAQENFALDYAEKKDIIQKQIDVVHDIQGLKTAIRIFAEGDAERPPV